MKLATKFLRVSVMLCLLVWMTHPTVKETAQLPKPELPKIALEHKVSKHVDPKRNQHPASSALATTQQQVSEIAPALKWLTPYLAPASNRARGQKWLSPFVPSITASKTATQVGTDLGTSGLTPGDTLRYVVVIQNAGGAMDAADVVFTDQIDANTTLVPGSLKSAPIAIDDSYSTVGNTSISVPAGSGLLANDVNLNGTPMSATSINQVGTMGTVTGSADGSFTFNPDPGFEGTTTFTYTVSNGSFASVGTVTITVTGLIWYINASAAAGGDGRLNTPFNSINAFNATSLDGTGDNIFVYSGTYNNTSSTILLGQQKLIGQGAVGASLAALAGVTFSVHPPMLSATIPTVGGTRPTINQAANNTNMQSQNQIRGVNINNTGGTALLANGFTSATVRDVSITNTGGVGVNFNNGALDVIIQSISASNANNAISVTNTTGSFQVSGTGTTDGSGGTLTSISGRGIDLRTATNITLKNMTLTSANTTDGGAAGDCDEVNVLGCFAAVYMDGVNTVTLDNMDIGGTEEHGIMGNSVSNLSINNCTSTSNGNLDDENALKFRNLSGTCSITNSQFQNSAFRVCHIINTTGNVNLTVSNCVFNNTAASAVGQDCFEMRTQGSATATVNLIGSSFQRARTKAIQIQAEGTSTINANITYCRVERFGGAMAGIDVASNGAGSTMNYNINNNPVIESSSEVAALSSTLNSTLNGRLNRNLSLDNNYPLAGGSTFAIVRVLHDGSDVAKVEMKGNPSVTGNNLDLPVNFVSINGTNVAHRLDAILDSNIVVNNGSGGIGIEGIYLRVGTTALGGKINTLCGDVTRNKVTVPASAGGRAFRANRVDNTSFLTLSGTSPVATMWPGNNNSNTNGALNATAGVVFTGVAPPGCNGPIHASFAPSNEEIASIVNDGKLNDQALAQEAADKDLTDQQKNAPVKPKAPKEKEVAPAALQMMMAGETVTVGAPSGFPLPAGKQITIRFDVVINTPLPTGVCQISNQGSVSGSNIIPAILTDDPGVAGAANPTVTQLSKHSLGNLVFRDNNKNGSFDGGDVGIPAVVVNLYRDNGTTPGILDATDAFVTTTNTVAGGLYLFSNLCSDEYIVQIPSSEFGPGEPLNGLLSSPTGAASDPDNNTDSDDNGQDAINSSIATQAITINYSTSFVENNTTLDLGFKTPTNVSIGDLAMNEGSGGGTTTFNFTVTRDDISEAFSLDVNTGVISANNGDYTAISGGTVSFTAGGSNTATVSVTVTADDIVELTETFNVLLSNAPAGVVITDGIGLGTITNDDQATLSINSVSNTEGDVVDQLYTFIVTLDKAVDVPFSVDANTVSGSAAPSDSDFGNSFVTFSFAGTAGETKTKDITVYGDTKVEPNESFTIPLSNVMAGGRNVVISGPFGTGTGTITNDDAATISINDVSLVEGNAGTTNFVFTVTLSNLVSNAVTVNFTTANGTAGAGDYTTNSGMVTFPANTNGLGLTQMITVPVSGDVVGEANETFFVNLTSIQGNPPNITFGDDQGLGTILDDDLSFSINDVAIAEGNAGTTNLTFTVTRTSSSTIETINYQTADNTATTGDNDYVAKNGTLNFAIGDATEDITIVINGDNIVEATESFFVNLSAASNGSIANAQGVGTITNDDLATITLSGGIAQNEGNAGTTSYIFTATLDKAVPGGLSVPYTTNDGTATTADNDYQDNDGPLTFAGTANESQTITVLVNGDTKVEANETFTVSLGTITGTLASSVSAAGSPQMGTITNDDAATVTLAPISASAVEGNAGTTNLTFSVTLDNPVAGGFDLAYTTTNGTATTADNDYVDNDNTLSFVGTLGESKTITVQVNGDTKVEANETFSVALGALSGTTLSSSITLAGSPQTGTITNDDAATVTLAPISASANEGNAGTTNRTFSVTLDNPVAGGFFLVYTTNNGTATTADNDYVDNDNTFTFVGTAGESKTITVQVNGDTKVEANETFSVALGALSGTTLGSSITLAGSPQTGTITNDDAATVTLAPISATANEGNAGTTNFTFSVTLDNPVAGGFDLAYTTSDATATTADNDYVDNDNTLSFAGTLGESKTITVQVNGDTKVEANETFSVALGALSATTLSSSITLAGSPQTGTITNDDAATVTLAPISATANEGNAGTTNFTFSVTLDNPVAGGFDLAYTTNNGTATTADNDYVDNDNTLNFAGTVGESKTITVQVNGDTKVEATETFSVALGALSATTFSSSITLAGSPQTGTITNDDAATISINDVSKVEGSSGACTNVFDFTVTLDNVVGTAVTLDWAVSGGNALSGSDYSGTISGTVTFPANGTGQTQHILINVCEDVLGEANETFNVNLSNIVGSASVTFADAQGLGTIEDDDLAFSINDVSIAEGNAGTSNLTFTVTRTSTATVETIQYATANNTATTVDNDYSSINGTLNFSIGDDTETITVVLNGDTKVELNETFFVNLSNASNGAISDAQGVGTINNDDQATLTIDNVAKTEGNAGTQTYTFTVSVDNAVDAPFSVNVGTVDGTATAGTDYATNSTTLNFAGTANDTKTFDVIVNGDLLVEPTEIFTVPLSAVSANGRDVVISGPAGTGTGTITNDDAATISIDDVTLMEGDAGTVNFVFNVTLSKVVSTAVTVDFATAGVTAASGVDFNPNSNTITFPANGTGQTQTITVQVIGDVLGEANETFNVNLSNIVGSPSVTFADAQGLGTILDDDLAFSINDVSIAEGNAGTTNLTFTVTRTSTATVETIQYATANNTATTADNDYASTNGTLNFAIGDDTETITVVLNGDLKVEANETFFVNLSNASNGNISDAQGVGTINNDDAAVVHLQLLSATKAEGNVGTTNFTFTATLNNPVQGGFDLAYTTDDATATTANSDYQDNDGTLSFTGTASEQKTITVLVNGDTDVELDETFTVSIENNGFSNTALAASLSTASTVIATIQNDDSDIDAGNDITICASTVMIQLQGTVSGASTGGTWTTSGTGTFIPNANDLNAKYMFTAADTAAGVVNLTLTGNGPSGEFDVKIVTIDPAAIVNAGPDQTICATDTIRLSATLSGVATSLVWQLNATFGTFVGPDTSPNAKYVLNATGQQLSSIKFGVMSNDPSGNVCQGGLDTVQIFINPAAYVNAGNDETICASQASVQLNGSISGAATSATWTTSGTGTFSPNATTLNATYTPSNADTAANTVTLTLTTNDPTGLCGPVADTKIITIDPASIVNAGPDQTICATDTIRLSATLSGVATSLVWQLNAAFGNFVGPDTSPNAKYVLNATGQQLSSIKFGVMSNDPSGNVCQGGLDTVEIFLSDPINASVSIDQDTICVGAQFKLTFNESTLAPGSEFTVVVKYTDQNGAGSKTLSNVVNGAQTTFEEGVDFDGILTVTQIIVNPESAGFCSDTLAGFKVEVVVCEAMISDPCVCQNNAQIAENGSNSNTGTFSDKVTIDGPINQTWTVTSVTGYYENAAGTDPVDVGDVFTQVSPGLYELVGYHIDAIGYTISVSNGRGVTLQTGNKCFYPNPVFTGLPALVAPSAAPFQVKGTVADNAAGTGTFILDGVPQAGASAAPTVLTINPGALSPGPHTLVYSFDAGLPASKDSLDPGCVQQVRQRFQVANCGCQDVTVSLDANCKFLLTGSLVSDVNCGAGTVRVMDNDPSNGGLIDCAGVWTYGLFDAFGNIICWGKVTAEDKTAPALICPPADISLDCYDVNYVLNNRLTIGNVDALSSPRPAATSSQTILNAEGVAGAGDNCNLGLIPPALVTDNIKNLGYAYFKDNCFTCGCRVTLKWSDKVVFYSCDEMKTNGGIYATILREWVATDCNGLRSDYTQKINFYRPAVKNGLTAGANDRGLRFRGAGTTGAAATVPAPNYDWVVQYTSCTPDKSLIKKADVTPSFCSFFNTVNNPRCLFLDEIECNYSVQIKDTEFPICGGKGVKIDRELYVFDWCTGGIVDTFHILIKIGDFTAPTAEYAHGAPFDISTGPMDCTAAIPVTVNGIKSAFGVSIVDNCGALGNVSVSVYTKDRYVKGILVYTGPTDPFCTTAPSREDGELRGDHDAYRLGDCSKKSICWDRVEYAVMNGMMIGLPVGRHLMVIDAFDGCYNASKICFLFDVVDKIAPLMKCDDDLHITLSNANGYTNGYAQVSADDIDEGSWDNCKMAYIAVRRNVPTSCVASFIAKGYDTNNNNKLDPAVGKDLNSDGDYNDVGESLEDGADGFDLNGDGDIKDFGETFILKGGKLMTPLQDIVEFFCCDLAERVTIELWGEDIYGNRNFCWDDVLIEDKVAPTCLAPWAVTIYCDDKGLAQIDDKAASAKIFGDITIPSGNDCAALDTVYSTVKKLKCGAGYIDRIWTLTKQTVKGPISITCTQRINILPVHEYNICFPKDVSTDCKTPIIDTVIIDELGCDILAVNVLDKRYDASDDECYKIFRTYSVINWCTYDDRCGDPLLQTNVHVIDRAVFDNYGKAPIYLLVRDNEGGVRDGVEEFWASKDLIVSPSTDIRDYPIYCTVAGEYIHSFIYTQIIKVYDDTRPVVTGDPAEFCIREGGDCLANLKMVITGKDNCTDQVTLETQYLMIAPNQTLEAGKMIMYATPRWSTKDLGNGQFEINVANLPEGKHDLIVVVRDECGNLSVPTRIPFTVKDCKGPAPICINGLSTELMPDGAGGGMMAIWASDFVASKIYDCNGQGPETVNGLKLVTKYSINRVGSPVDQNQTGLNLTCADKSKIVLVELHAWDTKGNHDFCVTYIEVQDNRSVCPGSVTEGVAIAGTIATEGAGSLQGVSVTLSGSGTQNDMTGTDGNYEFVNISKGGDFTVTPQLDKNHLNGVSTFDLVLIQKHILGVQALNSPYKMIAADANNSKSISTLDLIALRKLILNIDTHFANNTSWRFVDATYRFPNATNPWSASFPEVVSVNDLTGNIKANFVAIKIGDVNASASVNGAASAEIRTNSQFKLKTLEQTLKAGNEYRVAFTAEDLQNIQGYQFALNLDQSKVELLDMEYGVAKAENFGIFKNEGLITTSWNGKYEPGTLFTMILRAKADAQLSSALSLNRTVSPEAYDQNSEYLGIALNYEGISAAEAYELKQNTPNPFSNETVIGFSLPKATKGTLTVRDVKGALIYKVEGNYAKGNNQVTLKKEQLGASGVLYYTLETNDFTATKKMIILQ